MSTARRVKMERMWRWVTVGCLGGLLGTGLGVVARPAMAQSAVQSLRL